MRQGHKAAGSWFHLSVISFICVFGNLEKWHNELSVILSLVVAGETLVRGLKKLPEDIEWSYSGLYELFLRDIPNNLRCFVNREWTFWVVLRISSLLGRYFTHRSCFSSFFLENPKIQGAFCFWVKMALTLPKADSTGNSSISLVNIRLNSLDIRKNYLLTSPKRDSWSAWDHMVGWHRLTQHEAPA